MSKADDLVAVAGDIWREAQQQPNFDAGAFLTAMTRDSPVHLTVALVLHALRVEPFLTPEEQERDDLLAEGTGRNYQRLAQLNALLPPRREPPISRFLTAILSLQNSEGQRQAAQLASAMTGDTLREERRRQRDLDLTRLQDEQPWMEAMANRCWAGLWRWTGGLDGDYGAGLHIEASLPDYYGQTTGRGSLLLHPGTRAGPGPRTFALMLFSTDFGWTFRETGPLTATGAPHRLEQAYRTWLDTPPRIEGSGCATRRGFLRSGGYRAWQAWVAAADRPTPASTTMRESRGASGRSP